MINKKTIYAILLILILILVGCSGETQDNNSGNNDINNNEEPKEEIDPIAEQIKKMSLEEKIGQMVIVGLDGYTIDDNAKSMIENYYVGGFILFGRNVENSDQLLNLINSLKENNSKNKVPLFISVDEEGGRVSRMPEEFNDFPTNKVIGKVNDENLSYEIGNIIGEEIKSFGFNMNFAPVLDINSNPKNPVIGDRSFGSEVDVVSRLGIQTMKGIQDNNVIPVVKHFPGHGDTSVDSHVGLPSINNDMERLKDFELIPFKEAINNNADAIMIAHILLNKIDPENPASLSKTIITDLLRRQMNFNGVVITDDMTMGAIVENYNISDASVKAINAGSDIVLVCHEEENMINVIDSIKNAVENGIISRERLDESVYRIIKLKDKYNLTDDTINSIDIEKINDEIKKLDTYFK